MWHMSFHTMILKADVRKLLLHHVLMEFASALGICGSPALVGVQETLDCTAAWGSSKVLECFSAGDPFQNTP